MKTIILLLSLFFFTSCTDDKKIEYFNPAYQIKVDFSNKEAWEAGLKLKNTSLIESEICKNIITDSILLNNVKYSELCSGGDNKDLNFHYVIISGIVNGYFLIISKNNDILSFRLSNYDSTECLKKWITDTK